MSRPVGVRNPDFEKKRQALLESVANFVLAEGVKHPSLRQLAIAANTSEPTLRHYFGDRSGVVIAIIQYLKSITEFMRTSVARPAESLSESIAEYLKQVETYRDSTRYIRGHGFCMRESMLDDRVREAYLTYLIEPGIAAIAEKLVKSKGGPKNYSTAKSAAMMLMSSSVFVILHQELMNGKEVAPIDISHYFGQAQAWLDHGMNSDPDALGKTA